MSDKMRTLFPISVDFTSGELPSASKLNGLSSQTQQALRVVEYALGDTWNQGGDSILSGISDHGAALMIPNVARYTGAAKNLSPQIPYLPYIEKYTHDFTNYSSEVDARLPFLPAGGVWSYAWTGTSREVTPETNKGDVNTSTEWWVDEDTGDIYVGTPFVSGDRLEYRPAVDGDLGTDATFNIIPDLDTQSSYAFQGVKIEYKNGTDADEGYMIYLPPRGPLTNRIIEQSPQDDARSPSHSENFQSSPETGERLFWQSDTVDGCSTDTTNAEHYRYLLPKIITDNWSSGSIIPAGMIYLWDSHPSGTGTIIEGLAFSAEAVASPRKWALVVTGTNLTNWLALTHAEGMYSDTDLQSSSHDAQYYPSNGLRLIAVGSDISSAFTNLLSQFLNHDHGSSGSLVTRGISHNKLTGLFSAGSPAITSSSLSNDDHPQYLERHGYASRDPYYNSMIGDLHMASTTSTSNYLNISGDSNKVSFGVSGDTGSSLLWNSALQRLQLRSSTTPANTGLRISHGGSSTAAMDLLVNNSSANKIYSQKDLLISVENSGNFDIAAAAFTNTLTGNFSVSTPTFISMISSGASATLTGSTGATLSGGGNSITVDGTSIDLNAKTIFNGDAEPVNTTKDFGSATKKWQNIYATNIVADTITGSISGSSSGDTITCNTLTVNTTSNLNGTAYINQISTGVITNSGGSSIGFGSKNLTSISSISASSASISTINLGSCSIGGTSSLAINAPSSMSLQCTSGGITSTCTSGAFGVTAGSISLTASSTSISMSADTQISMGVSSVGLTMSTSTIALNGSTLDINNTTIDIDSTNVYIDATNVDITANIVTMEYNANHYIRFDTFNIDLKSLNDINLRAADTVLIEVADNITINSDFSNAKTYEIASIVNLDTANIVLANEINMTCGSNGMLLQTTLSGAINIDANGTCTIDASNIKLAFDASSGRRKIKVDHSDLGSESKRYLYLSDIES